jgi:hypothetical protein
MSTQAYSSHSQTRQQLDELDALLQRMLDLPMNSEPAHVEPFAAVATAPLPPVLSQGSVLPRPATIAEPMQHTWRMTPPDLPRPAPVDTTVDAQFAAEAPYPYSMVYGQQPVAETLPPFAEPVGSSPPEAAPYAAPAWAVAAASTHEPTGSFLLTPIIVLNGVFDALTYLLGPLGAWLRQGSGRNALGWLGIVMILGAIGLALADWGGPDWTP